MKITKKFIVAPILAIIIIFSAIYYLESNHILVRTNSDDFGIKQYIPKEDDKIMLSITTGYKNGTFIKDVKVTFTETEAGNSFTNSSTERGFTIIPITVGKTYIITATYKNSSKSETYTLKPNYVVDVWLNNNKIDSINCYKAGIP